MLALCCICFLYKAKVSSASGLMFADVLRLALPLHDASVDAVVSDVPFGAKHGTVDSVRQLLPRLVPSLHR